jgi:hypothetical protein
MLIALAASCKPDLNVTDPNSPDVARALASAGDVRNLIGNSFNTWQRGMQGGSEPVPGVAVAVMADNMTMAFGNFGARFNGQEPRLAYNNSSASNDATVASTPYDQMYGALGAAADGLNAISRGVVIQQGSGPDETQMMQSFAYLVQGLALGFEALVFDQGFVVDEATTVGSPTLQPYTAVSAAAVAKFDKAIAAGTGKAWTIPTEYTQGMTLTADKFVRMANTMAARQLAYTPRTATENAAVNWAKVLTYADAGISTGATPFNLQVEGDGTGAQWFDTFKYYGETPSWVRVDQRVVQLLDPTQPVVYTSTTPPPRAQSLDARLGTTTTAGTDYTYVPVIPFNPARGVYFFSQWQHSRYYFHSFERPATELTGLVPFVLAAENDLLIAEALVRTGGDRARAAQLINNTRVGRGNLPPVTAASSDNDLLAAIFYERDVELFDTGAGQAWFDRRRIDTNLVYNDPSVTGGVVPIPIGNTWGFRGGSGLQKGTPRHLPLPAKELETLGLPVYTYGGASPNPVNPEK